MRMRIHSCKVVQLAMICNDEVFSYGTGFFCSMNGQKYLVTNYHVASGQKPGTNIIINKDGAVPESLKFDYQVAQKLEDNKLEFIDCDPYVLKLYQNDWKPCWIEHPQFGNECDVVAIPLPPIDNVGNLPERAEIQCINIEEEIQSSPILGVMDSLFITGYPMVKEKTYSRYPIYKSGFLASEPYDPQNGLQFYVDAKTKPGMSGSPVIRLREPFRKEDSGNVVSFGVTDFIGIYSGRANPANDEYTAELGIVWPYKDFLVPILRAHQNLDVDAP